MTGQARAMTLTKVTLQSNQLTAPLTARNVVAKAMTLPGTRMTVWNSCGLQKVRYIRV
jgi:hypothetical protein